MIQFIQNHNLLICFALAAVGVTIWWLKFQKELNINIYTATFLAVAHFVLSMITTKLWAILEVGGNLEEAANMRLYGALFLLPPLYYLWAKLTKRNIPLVMDASCISCAIGLIFARFNCLRMGCCDGLPIVWGESARWPLREIELVYCFGFLLYFGWKILKKQSDGLVVPKMFISYGILRFLMEWVRDEYTGSLGIFHLAHIWSLIAIVVGAIMYYFIARKNKSGEVCRKKPGKHPAR